MTKTTYISPHNLKAECVFELSAMDCLQAALPPIAFSMFYDHPIDIARFQDALSQTLVHFPLLAGRLHRFSNRKVAPFQVLVHPMKGGAMFATKTIKKPYASKEDRRYFPVFTGVPWPAPHEPHFTYGPLLKIKHTYVASANSSVLSFGFCHAIMDATTVGSFLTTLKAHYNAETPSAVMAPNLSLERVDPCFEEGSAPTLDRFTPGVTGDLVRSLPKLVKSATGMKHVNLTIQKTEMNRLKKEFLTALDGELEWISTYEMMGCILMRAFYMASKEELASGGPTELECRCVVDPRGRDANPHVTPRHQGNVTELPSLRLAYDKFESDDSWQKLCLQDFHAQLRAALKDPEQMTYILRRAQASYEQGHLHTTEGRAISSKIFARSILENNVCSYNSWLHIDWFDLTTFGDAKPFHMDVTKGMSCQDMFWLLPRTPTEVTIRATLPRTKAKKFMQELRGMNVAFEVQ